MARTVGSLLGIISYKYLQKTKKGGLEHHILIVSGLVFTIFMIEFVQWNTKLGEWIGMSLTGGAFFCGMTAANICILRIASCRAGVEVLIGLGIFGIGALCIPQFIRYFGADTYFYISIFYLVMSILAYSYPLP